MMILQTETISKFEKIISTLLEQGTHLGLAILKALIVFIIGRYVIKFINRLIKKLLNKQDIASAVKTFVASLANIVLIVMLIISVIGVLGIQTSSFAALIASAGVAIGIALSGNLSNFAGGLIILIFKPFKIGDYISTQNIGGTVVEIQIFHTILNAPDNIRIYIPNGILSSGFINNFNVDTRRVEWVFGVDYGMDFDNVRNVIMDVLASDSRIMPEPAPLVELTKLDASSVNIVARAWVKGPDYWDVYFNINKSVYKAFNDKGIDFPLPQLTIHQADKN